MLKRELRRGLAEHGADHREGDEGADLVEDGRDALLAGLIVEHVELTIEEVAHVSVGDVREPVRAIGGVGQEPR
jgi:hypothetical protein